MPHRFRPTPENIIQNFIAAAHPAIPNGNIMVDNSAWYAFAEYQVPRQNGGWQSAHPRPVQHRTSAPPRNPGAPAKIAYTGIVDVPNLTLYLCPLVHDRGSSTYKGVKRACGKDISPIDHYQNDAMEAVFGKDSVQGVKHDMRSGRTARLETHATMGAARIQGVRSLQNATLDDGSSVSAVGALATANYWETAGHRQFATRLGLNLADCAGFAVVKNGTGQDRHQVMFVSRLNQPHFGARGMSQDFADKILAALSRMVRLPKPYVGP